MKVHQHRPAFIDTDEPLKEWEIDNTRAALVALIKSEWPTAVFADKDVVLDAFHASRYIVVVTTSNFGVRVFGFTDGPLKEET